MSTGGDALSKQVLSTLTLSLQQIMSCYVIGLLAKYVSLQKVQLDNTGTSYQLFLPGCCAPLYSVILLFLMGFSAHCTTHIVHTTHVHAHVRNVYNWLFFESRLLDMDNGIHEM